MNRETQDRKFKPGDQVVVISDNYAITKKGYVGVVIGYGGAGEVLVNQWLPGDIIGRFELPESDLRLDEQELFNKLYKQLNK